MNLKAGRAEAMVFGTGKRLNLLHGSQLVIKIQEKIINTTTTYKYLDVHLDPSFSLECHFTKMCKKAAADK
jgi:hypothetical protein